MAQLHPRYATQLATFLKIKRERFENRRRSMLGIGQVVSDMEIGRHEDLLSSLERGTMERLNVIASKRAFFRRTCRSYTKGDYVLRYVSSPSSWKHGAGAEAWFLYDGRTLNQKDSIRVRVS